jgi:hypothetical protein
MGALDVRGNLGGRNALVIGGGGGIGKAVTVALAEAQVDVAFCDVDSTALISTKAEVGGLGRRVVAEVADATDPTALRRFYQTAGDAFGHADIVVNVVGGVLMQPFIEKTPEACAEDIQRNYGYVLDSTRLAAAAASSILRPSRRIEAPAVSRFMPELRRQPRTSPRPWHGNSARSAYASMSLRLIPRRARVTARRSPRSCRRPTMPCRRSGGGRPCKCTFRSAFLPRVKISRMPSCSWHPIWRSPSPGKSSTSMAAPPRPSACCAGRLMGALRCLFRWGRR